MKRQCAAANCDLPPRRRRVAMKTDRGEVLHFFCASHGFFVRRGDRPPIRHYAEGTIKEHK